MSYSIISTAHFFNLENRLADNHISNKPKRPENTNLQHSWLPIAHGLNVHFSRSELCCMTDDRANHLKCVCSQQDGYPYAYLQNLFSQITKEVRDRVTLKARH